MRNRTILSLAALTLATLTSLLVPGSSTAQDLAFPAAAPESVGLSTAALDELAAVVDGYLDQQQIVGAELLVIKNRRTVLHRTFGWRDRENETPMTPGTIFNVRSMTKPLTGAAVQMLIDDGELSLADPAARFLPGFDNDESREITVEQLLTHRSGLPVTILIAIDQYEDLQSMANAAGKRGPQFPPDSKFWYSDPGTDVLGAIVERVSGLSLEEFWESRLFEPLGMRDSFVPLERDDPRWQRLATAYIGVAGDWNPFWRPDADPLYPYAWGSQTVYSTPRDYARFLTLWIDDGVVGDQRLLSEAAVERTLTPVSEMTGMGSNARMPTGFSGLSTYYGQMAVLWVDDDDPDAPTVVGHSGSDGTFAWAWPERDLMVLYFTQSRGGITGLGLERWIDDLLIHPDPDRGGEALTALYSEVVGEYLADFGSVRDTTLEIVLVNDRPAIDLGRGRVIELRDPDEDGRWAFSITDKTAVSFSRNQDGVVDALRMHEGPWSFEAPRKGVPIEPEIEPAELEKYLGTFHIEQLDADVDVVLSNHRLALDKSRLPGRRPTDLFELHPPDEEGRWRYRVRDDLHAEFVEESDGTVSGLRIFEGGELGAVGARTSGDSRGLPSVDEIMELRDTPEHVRRLAEIGGVVKRSKVTLTLSGETAELTESILGAERYRSELALKAGSIVEAVHPAGGARRQFGELFVHEGKYLEQARNAHPFATLLDWRDVFGSVEVIGRNEVTDREVYLVRTKDGETSPIVYSVDAETGDVLRTETVILSVRGEVPTVTRYEDFREVGGLRFPFRVTGTTQLGGDVVQEVEEILIGQELDPALFVLEEDLD